jgi:hypothetical protein
MFLGSYFDFSYISSFFSGTENVIVVSDEEPVDDTEATTIRGVTVNLMINFSF